MAANNEIEKRLWDAADELRTNSKLKASEYSVPVLGLIFFRYADHKFTHAEKELVDKAMGWRRTGKPDYSEGMESPRGEEPVTNIRLVGRMRLRCDPGT